MNKKKVLGHLATFAAGAATGKVVSDMQEEEAAANVLKEALFNPDMVLSACEALTDRKNDGVVRLGAARYLVMVAVKSVRDIIAARTLRRKVNVALASAIKDSDPKIRKAAQQAIDALANFQPPEDTQNTSSLKLKLQILRNYVRATPKEREEVEYLTRAEGLDPSEFLTSQRKFDFMAACLKDLKNAGRKKDQLDAFFIWLSRRPEKDLDLFAALCTEMDSNNEMYTLNGFTAVLEELQRREP